MDDAARRIFEKLKLHKTGEKISYKRYLQELAKLRRNE